MTDVIVAVITGGIALFGTLIGVYFQNKAITDKITHSLDIRQAVTDTKIEELTREVREHNNFAKRIPVVEAQIESINKRIDALEAQA